MKDIQRTKFRAQFSDRHWGELTSNAEFKLAWDANDLDTAGRLADVILIGNAKNKSEAKRLRDDYKDKKACDDILDGLGM